MSPISWLFTLLASLAPLIILLRPTLKELFVTLGVDYCALLLTKKIDKTVFIKVFPEARAYFLDPLASVFPRLEHSDRVSVIKSLFKFPIRRAFYFYVLSFFKTIPGMLTIVFYWSRNCSLLEQAILVVAIESIQFWYCFRSVFVDSHIYLSKLISELHSKFDLSEIFFELKIPYSKYEFIFTEVLSVFFIIIFTLVLHWTTVVSSSGKDLIYIAKKVVMVSGIAVILLCRLWYQNRNYFIGALEGIFKGLENTDYHVANHSLALHTSPLLAKFENTVNLLNKRIRHSEQELSSLVFTEAEKSRFRTLGEMSALIAHDLNSPLHVARFCVSQIEENPEIVFSNRRYIQQLAMNLDQAIDLTNSIRARIKNPNSSSYSGRMKEAHDHVLRLLGTQFILNNFKKVSVYFDERLNDIELRIQPIDLIHILDNIYKNSYQNLISNNVLRPFLRIELEEYKDDQVCIFISDNGTGLSHERFEVLTAFMFVKSRDCSSREGLGLRLTRRLVELNHGSLSIVPENNMGGTKYRLILPYVRVRQAIGCTL